MKYVLQTNALTKTYGRVPVVEKVSMNVKRGDIYGFIGKNGAGKTTFMRLVAGLTEADSGAIELFESNDLKRGKFRTGTTIEQPALYPYMNARQNVEVYQKLLGIPSKSEVDRVLEIVELQNDTKKITKNFSMGMKQRLAIAIALIGNPDFLMLDEPINGLDPTGIKNIRDLLLKLNQENQITILLSSHILGELAKIATCYGVINKGRLVDEFSAEQLEERCKRCVKIELDDVLRASSVLETKLGIGNYDVIDNHTVRIFERIDEPGEINSTLAREGLIIRTSMLAGQDLEGYFMELMGGAEHV